MDANLIEQLRQVKDFFYNKLKFNGNINGRFNIKIKYKIAPVAA